MRSERDVKAVTKETNAPWRDEELLRQKYVGDELSTRDLAELWGCDRKTISNWLSKYEIDTPSNPDSPPWQDRATLERLYVKKELTCDEIAEQLGCSGRTVDEWRRRHNITPLHKCRDWMDKQYNENGLYISEIADKANTSRKTIAEWLDKMGVRTEDQRPADYAEEKPWHDPERLEELYHGETLSARRVADRMGCSPQTVRHWLIEYGIERRPDSYRTIESEDSVPKRYPTVGGVLVHRFLAYAVGKMTFEELCDSNKVVHHRTNVGWDNRPENLKVMERSNHTALHASGDYEPEEV